MKKIKRIIIEQSGLLIGYLVRYKQEILGNKIIDLEFAPNKRIYINLLENDNLQFRLRYIKENDSFPINLFAIDYKTTLLMNINNQIYKQKFTIPFLDMALINNEDKLLKEFVVKNGNGGVPITTKKYLLYDIEKTYESSESSTRRFFYLKNEKDYKRYNALKFNENYFNESLNVVENKFSERNLPKEIIDFGEKYYKIFSNLIKKNPKLFKIKLKFNDSIEDDAMEIDG